MPVQVRNLNLNLIKLTQTRVTSLTTHLDLKTNNKGQNTASSGRRDDHFGQTAPINQPLEELLDCSQLQTQSIAKPNSPPKHLLDPCWGRCSLSTPLLPLPPVLNPQSLQTSPVYTSVHIPDFNSSIVKLANSTSQDVFSIKNVDALVDFQSSPFRGRTTSEFPLWEDQTGVAAKSVIEALDPGFTKSWPLRSSWTWDNSGPKIESVIYSVEEPKSSELTCSSSSNSEGSTPQAQGNGPSQEQLILVKEKLIEVIPVFFKKPHNYRLYHPELVFINNFWGKEATTKGLPNYMMELSKLRILSHLKFAHLHMNIVKITTHPEEGSIKIHWRVTGLPQLKTLMFWKFLPWTYRASIRSESQFFDGFSTLFIGCDELIYKHRVDRLMQDEEPMRDRRIDLSLKLGLLFGLLPRSGFY